MARRLKPIECSVQPLCMSFHPSRDILAAGLVDGTVEVHDLIIKECRHDAMKHDDSNNDEEDEDDTIISSIFVAKQPTVAQTRTKMLATVDSDSTPPSKVTQGPSCRCVLFSNSTHDNPTSAGEHLYTACNGGSLRCIDSQRICSLSHQSSDSSSILWSIEQAHSVAVCAMHQLPPNSPGGPLLSTGDDAGTIRLWDTRTCGTAPNETHPFDGLLKPPRGCIMQWHIHRDTITDFGVDDDGTTLFATSSDGTLSVLDVRFATRSNTPRSIHRPDDEPNRRHEIDTWLKAGYLQSDDQEDELLSLLPMKQSQKILVGTQTGALSVFSRGKWADISDRFTGHPASVDALLKIDDDTMLTGSSDGLIRAVRVGPNELVGVLGSHGGFPVEGLGWSWERRVVGSLGSDEFVRLWDGSFLREDGIADGGIGGEEEDDGIEEWEDMDEDENDEEDSDDESDDDNRRRGGRKIVFKSANEEFFQDL